jgi:hypothetical protein
MSNPPPPRKPRSWLDALIATTLRWNDRLGRTVVPEAPAPDKPPARTASRDASARSAAPRLPLPPSSRSR